MKMPKLPHCIKNEFLRSEFPDYDIRGEQL